MKKEHKETNEERSKTDRFIIYSRFFAKIPKYFNKAMKNIKHIKIVNNYGETVQLVFPKLEKPLFYLGIFFISQEVYFNYILIKNRSRLHKTLFFIDTVLWHSLASFLIPSFIISSSIQYFVISCEKRIQNKNILKFISISFSIIWIYILMDPIDQFTNYFLDNTFRKIIKKMTLQQSI